MPRHVALIREQVPIRCHRLDSSLIGLVALRIELPSLVIVHMWRDHSVLRVLGMAFLGWRHRARASRVELLDGAGCGRRLDPMEVEELRVALLL